MVLKSFLKNSKGAVTVFVTMLLIPAILVSGTAVDLARIHTARSIVQDANQLAANSVLTQYNALLYDLYGLFGVAKDDPIFASLLDEYIKVSVFGEERQDRSMGTLQLFYGSNIALEEPRFADDMNLRNEDVLKRQIEEYMKFCAPAIIVKEFLELTGLATFKEDSGIINDKLDIEAAIMRIHEKYKELYDAILAADRCDKIDGGISNITVGTVSSSLQRIRNEFIQLRECYIAWENATSQAVKNDYAAKYLAIMDNIRIRTVGGRIGSAWNNGQWTHRASSAIGGLNNTIENAIANADRHKPLFDNVVTISRELDNMKSELSRRLDELETRINKGECSPELKKALTERSGTPAKNIFERYRAILKWDNLEDMAALYRSSGYEYIDVTLRQLLESVIYRNRLNSADPSLTRAQLESIASESRLVLSASVSAANSVATRLANNANFSYFMPPFDRFADQGGNNRAFFEELEQMMNQPDIPPIKLFDNQEEASGANSEEKQINMIGELSELAKTAYEGMSNNPLGAKYINSGIGAEQNDNINTHDVLSLVAQARSNNVVDVISNPLGSVGRAGDYLLLLTYCTSVFTNYATARPDSNGKTRDELKSIGLPKSLTGVPLSPEVNYFFQSEWEYLHNGSENAAENLNAVSRLIFLIRVICNYITVSSVPAVQNVVQNIRAVFAWNPKLALILGELARSAFVVAESAVDVANLRLGHKVPLVKPAADWVCSPSGVKQALADISSDLAADGNSPSSNAKQRGSGLTYSNYLMFFFITKAIFSSDAAGELAKRTGDLIEWNIVNYQNLIYSDEGKMSDAMLGADRFKLEDMKTDFSLTTTVDMRMLFLSMFFSQNFSDSRGIGMPTTMPVKVTDYRGY